jgi:hypothetical protein
LPAPTSPAALLALAFALAACTLQPPGEGWERPQDRTPANVTDTSACHIDARRQAEIRYPQQSYEQMGRWPRYDDDRRFPAEMAFYRECMLRMGYVRAG